MTVDVVASPERIVGQRVRRVEDARLLTGRSRFVDDVSLPGMLQAAFVRSPHGHARVLGIDTAAAEAMPGVVAILTAADLEGGLLPLALQPVEELKAPMVSALAADRVRLVGEPVAIVVAEDRYRAEDAADAVVVEYEVLEAVIDAEAALAPDAPVLFDEFGTNELYRQARRYGDTDTAFAGADRVIRERFRQHRYANTPLEGHGCVSSFDPASGELTHHSSSQGPHALRLGLSFLLGVPLHNVRVLCGDVGGAFGSKGHWQREELVAAFASRRLGRPVKWIADRREALQHGGQSREELVDVEAAVRDDGTLLGLRVRLLLNQGAYPAAPYPTIVFPLLARALMPSAYRIVDYDFEIAMVATNKASYVAYRGPWETETWVRERLFDVIAAELGLDPVAVRRRNLWDDDELPRRLTTDAATLRDLTVRRCLDTVVDALDYDALRTEQERLRAEGRYVGLGFSCFIEPAPQPIFGIGFDFVRTETATAQLEPDGSLTIFTSQAPNGQGHETTIAQVCADTLGVPLAGVKVVHGDTRVTPFTNLGTGASRGATMATGAAAGATRIVKERALAIAGAILGTDAADLVIVDGVVVGPGEASLPLATVGLVAYTAPFTLPPGLETGMRATYTFDYAGGWAQACHCCVVEVDPDTGQVAIRRYVVAENCGQPIHPGIVDGQITGGITQGVGAVLYEHAAYGPDGTHLAGTFLDYLLPTAHEAPRVEIHHIIPEGDDVPSHGCGEGGNIGAPAAVTNAIEDALRPLGVQVREQHLPPWRIVELIGGMA